mmetsp:Transcript_48670/g.95142  ORF Transcript_48670/g.95142 Transcript_48670/m.95142 type:complete len:277 (-) Transcript_48670:8-838(-)
MFTSPFVFTDTEETRASCSCSASSSRNSGSKSSTLLSSNAPTFRMSAGSMLLWVVRWMVVVGFSVRSSCSIRASSSSPPAHRSTLLSRILSEKHTCSTASFSTPAGFSSRIRASTVDASHTVTTQSSRYRARTPSSIKNVWHTGAGSASPVVSMMTPSKSATRSCRRTSASTRSPRTVQQMHPFITSMSSSSTFSARMPSSTPTSPNSFSITANFRPCVVSLRMLLRRVVLPEPRKPVRTVTGTREERGIFESRSMVAGTCWDVTVKREVQVLRNT